VDRAERDPTLMMAINAHAVAELCDALEQRRGVSWSGVRLVHVGSALEYGQTTGPITEDAEPHPTNDYGRSKLAGTAHVARWSDSTGLPSVVARLFNVYGPGEHPGRLLPSLERAAESGARVGLSAGTQRRDFTYVEDAAEGLLRLALSPVRPGEVVNLASGRLTSVREFAETAADVLGIAPGALDFGAVPARDDELCHGPVDVTRLRQLTAWVPPTSLADGIRRSRERGHDH
jgi:nucleoside-diphosphate-sugar epimerase